MLPTLSPANWGHFPFFLNNSTLYFIVQNWAASFYSFLWFPRSFIYRCPTLQHLNFGIKSLKISEPWLYWGFPGPSLQNVLINHFFVLGSEPPSWPLWTASVTHDYTTNFSLELVLVAWLLYLNSIFPSNCLGSLISVWFFFLGLQTFHQLQSGLLHWLPVIYIVG